MIHTTPAYRRFACAVLLALALNASAAVGAPQIRGVALGHYTEIRAAPLLRKLREIKRLGATHVSIVVSWSTPNARSDKIAPRRNHTTSPTSLRRMISAAHHLGLSVLLFPILDVQHRKPLEWRGTLSPRSWDRWWRSYHRFLMHYTRVAARMKVDILCVGSELVATESQLGRWRELIGKIRTNYSGKLLYSANWDHYKSIRFWQSLDYIGLTGYYELSDDRNASQAQLTASWRRLREQLLSWSGKVGKPLIFTEVGYPNLDGAAVHPWDYTQGTGPDPEEQRRAYAAFARAWEGTGGLAGVFFWDWYGEGGPKDTRYTPRGKPAEEVIRSWFAGK